MLSVSAIFSFIRYMYRELTLQGPPLFFPLLKNYRVLTKIALKHGRYRYIRRSFFCCCCSVHLFSFQFYPKLVVRS